MNIISLKNITKQFGKKVILKDFNLDIGKGEFLSIMGSSGSGKSTLLNMIGLLETPDFGEIKIIDYVKHKFNSKEGIYLLRNEISYLFQNYGLVDSRTVNYNLKMATHFLKLSNNEEKEKIKNALLKVGLKAIQNEKSIF